MPAPSRVLVSTVSVGSAPVEVFESDGSPLEWHLSTSEWNLTKYTKKIENSLKYWVANRTDSRRQQVKFHCLRSALAAVKSLLPAVVLADVL